MELRWVHPDVAVLVGAYWDTTCTAVRRGGELLLIDSPVRPDEHEWVRAELERAGLHVTRRFATHAHWDHLLAGCTWPAAPLSCGRATAAELAADPERQHRHLAEYGAEHGIEYPPLPLDVAQALDVPGTLSLGDAAIELIQADGHAADGTACWFDWARVLVCGDYVSPVEAPHVVEGGSLDAYVETLERLTPFIARADAVVPGHGPVLDAAQAQALLAEDVDYLQQLREAPERASAPLRGTDAERTAVHRDNLAHVGALAEPAGGEA